MEIVAPSPETESVAATYERARRLIGAYGLYDASLDFYPVTEHKDVYWAVELDENTNIIKSSN